MSDASRLLHRIRTSDPRYLLPGVLRRARRILPGPNPSRRTLSHLPSWSHLETLADSHLVPRADDPVVESADRFLVGGIALLGRRIQPWKIGWQTDPRTEYSWGETREAREATPPPGSDIKVPWEVSRFYFAPWLAAAGGITGDERYLDALTALVEDFAKENPPGRGVNWQSTMEVAIRGANITVALATVAARRRAFRQAAADSFRAITAPLIAGHGDWIRRNLEKGPGPPANHLLVDFAGLALCGWAMAEARAGRRWLAVAGRGLAHQAKVQVDAAGAHVEQSPSYHRLCAEALAGGAAALVAAGTETAGADAAKISAVATKMFRFTAAYTRPDGSAPELADSDDGRFVVSSGMFDFELHHHEYLRWMLDAESRPIRPHPVESFTTAGYVFARRLSDGEETEHWASFRAGPFGRYCGHVHSDQLHVTWSANRANLILDPGTGDYGGDIALRNRLRSAQRHNAPIIDELDPNGPISDDIFWMRDKTRGALTTVRGNEDTPIEIAGEHSGYADRGISVARRIVLDGGDRAGEGGIEIRDLIDGEGRHSITWSFCLGGEWNLVDGVVSGRCESEKILATFETLGTAHESPSARLTRAPRSPAYGETEDATWLELSWDGELPAEFKIAFNLEDSP